MATDAKRSALLVSADTYSDPKLKQLRSPAADAEALRRVLASVDIGGFDVEMSINDPEHVVRRKIEQFFQNRGLEDLLLLHFGCHGIKDDDGQLYFASTNTELARLDSTAISADFVNRQMGRSRSRRIVLLLDCCYSGAFAAGATPRAAGSVDIGERFSQGHGRFVLTASTAMEYSWEGDLLTDKDKLGASSFTAAVVHGLESGDADRDQDERISLDDLSNYVYEYVRERNPKQTPQKWSFGSEGDLYIAKTPPAARRGAGARHRHDYAALRPEIELAAGAEVFAVAISPDNRTLAAGSVGAVLVWRRDSDIRRWSGESAPQRIEDVHEGFVYSVAFSPDGRRLATGGYDRQVHLLDASTGARRRTFPCSSRVSSVAFSPLRDARVLAIAGLDNSITLWRLGSGDKKELSNAHQSSVERVVFSPKGTRLASCGLDKAVRLWTPELTSLWGNSREHEYLVRGLDFSPDETTLASASWDKTIRVWDTEGGEPIELTWQEGRPRHTDWIWSVAFSPDGLALASGGSDSKIIVWMLPDAG